MSCSYIMLYVVLSYCETGYPSPKLDELETSELQIKRIANETKLDERSVYIVYIYIYIYNKFTVVLGDMVQSSDMDLK